MGTEGIVIKTVGNDLILAGGRPRGTLYAVYTFLEDHVGCRWWSSTASTIPKKPTLKIGGIDVRYVPPLEYRESFWFDAFDGDWAVRNKCNGHCAELDAKRGGKHIYQGFVHTFYPLIPPAEYFEDIRSGSARLTASGSTAGSALPDQRGDAPGTGQEPQGLLRQNPAATIASVSQNDWHGNCQCDQVCGR